MNYGFGYSTSTLALRAGGVLKAHAVLGIPPAFVLTPHDQSVPFSALTSERTGLATMVDSDGTIKWGPHNLAYEKIPNASTLTLMPNEPGPDGSYGEVYRLIMPASGGTYLRVANATLGAGINQTLGVWVKANGANNTFALIFGNGQGPDLQATSDWDYYSLRQNATNSGPALINNGDDSYATDILIWRPRLYRSDLGGMMPNPDTGDSYVPTSGAARFLGRRGHHVWNGSEWVKTAMLVEPSRTNLLPYSNNAENWTVVAQNLTRSVITGPDGQTASQWVASDTSSLVRRTKTSGMTGTTGQLSAAQFKVKDVSCRYLRLSWLASADIDFDLVSLTSTAAGVSFTPLADGWLLVRVPITPGATATDGAIFNPLTSIGDTNSNAGPGVGNGFALCDVQFETGGYPTTYIPTNGSTVTRAADTFEIPAALCPDFGSISLKGFMSYADTNKAGGEDGTFYRRYIDASNSLRGYIQTVSSDGHFVLSQTTGGVAVFSDTGDTFNPGVDVPFSIAGVHTASRLQIATNGSTGTEKAIASMADFSGTDLELGYGGFTACIAFTEIAIWSQDIGDAGLEEASA